MLLSMVAADALAAVKIKRNVVFFMNVYPFPGGNSAA